MRVVPILFDKKGTATNYTAQVTVKEIIGPFQSKVLNSYTITVIDGGYKSLVIKGLYTKETVWKGRTPRRQTSQDIALTVSWLYEHGFPEFTR